MLDRIDNIEQKLRSEIEQQTKLISCELTQNAMTVSLQIFILLHEIKLFGALRFNSQKHTS